MLNSASKIFWTRMVDKAMFQKSVRYFGSSDLHMYLNYLIVNRSKFQRYKSHIRRLCHAGFISAFRYISYRLKLMSWKARVSSTNWVAQCGVITLVSHLWLSGLILTEATTLYIVSHSKYHKVKQGRQPTMCMQNLNSLRCHVVSG